MNWPSVKSLKTALLLCPALVLAAGCLTPARAGVGQDLARILASKELLVAAVGNWRQANRQAWQGLEMAAKEINQAGGILGKPVKLWRNEVPDDPRLAVKQAQEIADNPETAMVVMSTRRDVALPMSIVLAYRDVLTLLTGESTPFHEVNLPMLYRLTPYDSDEMGYLTSFCLARGLSRVVIVVSDNDYAKIHANTFETEARAREMKIVSRLDVDPQASGESVGQELAALVKSRPFDAVFYSGPVDLAVKLIKAAAAEGIEQPFIGGSQWDTPELAQVADPRRTSVFLVTPFTADQPDKAATHFVDAYRQAYGEYPDAQAGFNYNALCLYAQAAKQAGTVDPDKVTDAMDNHFLWDGPLGQVRLNELGELIFPVLYIKHFANGEFKTLDFHPPGP
jgi:branched-chain amino acid transport system substrate-binding protein